MRKRFGVPLVLLALFLGVSLIGWSAVFAADLRYVSIDIVEKKVDCISGYLEDVHNLFVPNDFKPTLMGQIEADENGLVETGIVDDPTAATNDIVVRASQAALGASPSPENFLVLTAFIGVLTGDPLYADYTDERCDIAEAYEEPYEGEIVLVPQGGGEDPFIPDPDPDPDPDPEEGWIYYGKEYDRDDITTRAADRSTNGILYLSDEEIRASESNSTESTDGEYEGSLGYGGFSQTERRVQSCSKDYPPMIAPYAVMGYGGYGGNFSISGSEIIAEGVMPAPEVEIEEDRFYRYTWTVPVEGLDSTQDDGMLPEPSFSATLYDNHWIGFGYNGDMDEVDRSEFLEEGEDYTTDLVVGLHPGGHERWNRVEERTHLCSYVNEYQQAYRYDLYDEWETLSEEYSYLGGDDQPGPGQPRSDFYTYEMDLSEQYGKPLDDIFFGGEDGALCWLPIMETFEGYYVGCEESDFDLADRRLLFRPYQMIANWVPGEEGVDPYHPDYGYGGFSEVEREDTDHKYTVTVGSKDAVVDDDAWDAAIAMVQDNPDLLFEIDDVYSRDLPEGFKVGLEDRDGNYHVQYSEIIKHGAFKPGCFNSCHIDWEGEDEGYLPDGSVRPDPDFPGIERWPVAWTNTVDMYGEDEYGWASEFNNYKYGDQRVGYGGYYSNPTLFASEEALEGINRNGFVAYAVQVEEDIVNRKILGLQSMRAVADSVRDAQATAGIRARDAWFVQTADAQSGRVTKDQHGNWVRAQQYVLRSADNTSVQVVNASLRSGSDISSMVFTTNFAGDGYAGNLTKLPWGLWLDTQTDDGGRFVYTTKVLMDNETPTPVLDSMSVEFSNSTGDSLAESRGFDVRETIAASTYIQPITEGRELLAINGAEYGFTPNATPATGAYTVNPTSDGFDYVLGGGDSVNVAFYNAEDGDRGLDTNAASQIDNEVGEGEYMIEDMWDALGVNHPRMVDTGPEPWIGGNLEIAISNGPISQPIDVIYIPMSRMLWTGEAQMPH